MPTRAGPPTRRRTVRAIVALLCVTAIWGWTFVWMKQCLLAAADAWRGEGTTAAIGLFLSLRFGLAALLLAIGVPGSRRGLTREVWRGGGFLGGVLLAGFLLQMLGLQRIAPAVSAFLTSLYVVFAALMTTALEKSRVKPSLLGGVLLATMGAAFIGGPPHLSFGTAEWLTIACAFVFAVHILATDRVTRRQPPLPVTLTSFLWVTLGSLATLALGLLGAAGPTLQMLVELAMAPRFAVPLLFSSLLATLVAITLINVYQRDIDPVRAAVLYALEPVWTSIIAISIGLGEPGIWLCVGGGAVLAGNLVAELGALRSRNGAAVRNGA